MKHGSPWMSYSRSCIEMNDWSAGCLLLELCFHQECHSQRLWEDCTLAGGHGLFEKAWRPGGGYRHAMAAWVTRWKQVVIGCHRHSHDTMSLCHIVAELPLPCLGKTCVTFFGKNLVQVHRANFPLWKSLDCAVRAQDAPGKHGSHFGFSLQSWQK